MYASSTLFFAAILALARIALTATPPACLIAALGAQSNPSDLKSLCGTLEQQVAGNITEKCSGDAESSAMSVFSATCLASESVTIKAVSTSSSSGSNTAATTTGSSSAKATASGSKTTGTAASTGSSTGTSSGSTASGTSKSSGSSLASSQSVFIVAPLVLVASFAQYLL